MGKVEDRLDDFFDRHPWLAFPLGALMMSVVPLLLLEQAFDEPQHWPRIMVGAAIGAGVVAIPAALALVRTVRRMAFGALALVVVAAILIAVAMKRFHGRDDPVPLSDPTQAEWTGGLAAIVTLGAVAVLLMGVYGALGQTLGRRHHAWVEESASDPYAGTSYAATCACGWRGKIRPDSSTAFVDAGDHANRVDITVRKPHPSRTRQTRM